MNALVRSTYAAVTFAAVVLLASCGGGSGSTLGSTELPNVQSAVLPAANATSVITVTQGSNKLAGVTVTLSYDRVVKTGKTGPMGKIRFWFAKNEFVCIVAEIRKGHSSQRKQLCQQPFPPQATLHFEPWN
jgi:hypothetical protein